MAPQQIVSTQPTKAFDRIPAEIWFTIAQLLPGHSLVNFVLSSRKLYVSANPHLYRAVSFFGTIYRHAKEIRDACFGVHRAQSWLAYPDYSSPIRHVESFSKTITTQPSLRYHINRASFGWDGTATAQKTTIAKKCIECLTRSLSLLHLALPNFDVKFAITTNVTFLELVYPDNAELDDLDDQYDIDGHHSLRDSIYSIFLIPTLRHLSLKVARTWQAFESLASADDSKVGTSNIISLSLPDTVPLSRDLKEILTWPKDLRHFYHGNKPDDNHFFQNHGTEQLASPKLFIEGVQSQRLTVEELFYNNREDCCGNDGTTFGKALREFIKLKRLAVPMDALIADGEDTEFFHETLPPNLEEAWIQISSDYIDDDNECAVLKRDLQGLLTNKEQRCLSLRRLVLWMDSAGYDIRRDAYPAEAGRMLNKLDLVSTFHKAGIQLDLTVGQRHSFGA